MNIGTGSPGKLDALTRRAADIKVALKQVQAQRRAQERADRQRLESLIGEALLADAEADTDSHGARKAYISEALDKYAAGSSRAFLKAKGWL